MEIQAVPLEELKRIIEQRIPIGHFYTKHDGRYIAVDNRTGDAWTEDFDTLNACYGWMRGSHGKDEKR